MRSYVIWVGPWSNRTSALKRQGKDSRVLSPLCEGTARRRLSASQGESPHQKPNTSRTWPLASSLHNCGKLNLCCLCLWVFSWGIWSRLTQGVNTPKAQVWPWSASVMLEMWNDSRLKLPWKGLATEMVTFQFYTWDCKAYHWHITLFMSRFWTFHANKEL